MPSHVYMHPALPARPQPAPNSNKHRTTATIFISTCTRLWATVCTLYNGSPYAVGPLSVCLSCLSVTLVYCGQAVRWIKMQLGLQVGIGPGDIVLDGDRAPAPPKRGQSPQFSAHVYCGQTDGWIKMPLGREVGLGPGHIVLHGYAAPTKRGTAPNFRHMSIVAKWSPIYQLQLSTC